MKLYRFFYIYRNRRDIQNRKNARVKNDIKLRSIFPSSFNLIQTLSNDEINY